MSLHAVWRGEGAALLRRDVRSRWTVAEVVARGGIATGEGVEADFGEVSGYVVSEAVGEVSLVGVMPERERESFNCFLVGSDLIGEQFRFAGV